MSTGKSKKSKDLSLPPDAGLERLSRKQYNRELNEAVSRMEKGNSVSHKDALKELSKW